MDKAKATEEKKVEIKADLEKSIEEIKGDCENQPIALLNKNNYKIWSPHKQVSILQRKYKNWKFIGLDFDNRAAKAVLKTFNPINKLGLQSHTRF